MNVDEAISEVNTNIRPNPRNFNPWYYEVAITIAAEIERLRAELAELRQKRCGENSEIELQALRVLDSSEVGGDSDSVPPTGTELVELMADTAVMAMEERNLWHSAAQRLKDELAAAKAASVCPVKFDGVYANSADEAVVWFEETGKAEQFADWLRQLKERGEQ